MTGMTKEKFLSLASGLLAASLLGGALPLGAFAEATPEQAVSAVDDLVAQGTRLADCTQTELEALLEEIDTAKADADEEDLTRLANLSAAVEDSLKVLFAADAGELSELPQTGRENSWRYQNGSLVEDPDAALQAQSLADEYSIATFNADGKTHTGIDVSYHQGSVDWNAVKNAGIEFAMLRCGFGDNETEQDDSQWAANVSACEALGIPYGVYLYSYATDTDHARSEAEHVLRLVAGHKPSLPIFLDLEENRTLDQGTDAIGAMAQTFCDIVQGAGYPVGIYANQLWWNHYLTAGNFNNNSWYRWIANWGTLSYGGRLDMWQYTNRGSVSGVNGRVDMDYWYGELSSAITPAPTPTLPPVDEAAALAFTTRLYQVCLGRDPDPAGLSGWVDALRSHRDSGTSAAYGFVFSAEFRGKNYCNEDYVKQLYRAFLGREYDSAGLSSWVNVLEHGSTRESVFNGFAQSREFTDLCKSYGISLGSPIAVPTYGTVPTGPCSVDGKEDGVTSFVKRLYTVCLDRSPDASGLAGWTSILWNHTSSGRDVAHGFIFSDEFTGKRYDDATYIKYLYRAFLGREYDAPGLANWLSTLHNGSSREDIFRGFVGSQEFTEICSSYGIVRG